MIVQVPSIVRSRPRGGVTITGPIAELTAFTSSDRRLTTLIKENPERTPAAYALVVVSDTSPDMTVAFPFNKKTPIGPWLELTLIVGVSSNP